MTGNHHYSVAMFMFRQFGLGPASPTMLTHPFAERNELMASSKGSFGDAMSSEYGHVQEPEALLLIRRQWQAAPETTPSRDVAGVPYRRYPCHCCLVSACGRPSPHDPFLRAITWPSSKNFPLTASLLPRLLLPHTAKLLAGNVAIAHAKADADPRYGVTGGYPR
ncbi:hypothetical protein LX36DRAFT_408281 [Colletotrichum falcatum]|nr:hypothetical protein LX36DRAFT_408281 [Colletotrichum falcatum]